MKISTANRRANDMSKCHPEGLLLDDEAIGCFEDCTVPDPSAPPTMPPITGDYLLIPGGMYIETSATTGSPKTYMNDQFCGTGLGNDDSVVSVNLPGPVTVRSEKCSS